jgi:hypothetical protein
MEEDIRNKLYIASFDETPFGFDLSFQHAFVKFDKSIFVL